MMNFWRLFRFAMLFIGFLILGAYLFAATPWREWVFGKAGYETVIAEGQPLVDGVYRFRDDVGLWPQYLDDVTAKYGSAKPDTAWYYELTAAGPSLAKARSTDKTRTHIGFDFDATTPSWRVFGDMENRVLRTLPARGVGASSAPSAEALLAASVAELDRRILRERGVMEHWKAKISLLHNAGKIDEARKTAEEAVKAYPSYAWARLALAALNYQGVAETQIAARSITPSTYPASGPASGPATGIWVMPAGAEDFLNWVAANPSYTNWFYASVVFRLANDNPGALDALQQMAAMPMQLAAEDDLPLAFYAWDASRFALKMERWDLVIALCDQWEKAVEAGNSTEYSFLPIRAGAKLPKGDFAGAQADIDRLWKEQVKTWSKNEPALEAAIKAKNTGYRYNPGAVPPEYVIFPQPK